VAKGKIIYPPLASPAISLDGAHYLSLAEAAFNVGTQDFGVDALIYINPAVADSECWIAAKGVTDLANAAGWHWYYKKTSRRLGLRINDGGTTALVVETADNQIPALATRFWARVQADRDGQARFYVNGADVGGGSIAAKAGSLNNSEPLKIGGNTDALNRHQGLINFIRFDAGRILPDAWHPEEWDRIRYGCIPEVADFLARWNFASSLTDASANGYILMWQGTGDPVYSPWYEDGEVVEYLFAKNFGYGHKPGYLDLDDRQRMLDASDFTYPHPNPKRTFLLPFKNIAPEQQAAFTAAWASKQPVRLYLDADRPQTAIIKIITYPLHESVFSDRVNAELDMEEV